MLRFVFLSLFIVTLSLSARAQVWEDTNSWSQDWEDRYAAWVEREWNVHYFSQKTRPDGSANPFYGLHPDCADTIYSMRLIFSYYNKLPFAVLDPTGSGKLITNRVTRYNGSSAGVRAKKFLNEMYSTIATATLPNDTFPVPISPRYVRSGALMMTTHKNHHSWSVKEILPIGVPWLVFASRVSAWSGLTLQERQSWPNPYWVFEGNSKPAGHAGFRAFRPIEFIGKPVWTVPGYSEEQYGLSMDGWVKFATKRLAVRHENDQQMINRLVKTACDGMVGRVQAVKEGLEYLRTNGTRCMSYETYDNFSTPNRDRRVFDDLMVLRSTYRDMIATNGAKNISTETRAQLSKIFPAIQSTPKQETAQMREQSTTADSICPVTYDSGKTIDLAEGKRRLFSGLMSNNPLDGLEYRWGERRGPSAEAQACQSWDIWIPETAK